MGRSGELDIRLSLTVRSDNNYKTIAELMAVLENHFGGGDSVITNLSAYQDTSK